MILDKIKEILRRHEGLSLKPYIDRGNIAIGYGRNLTVNGISLKEAELMLEDDIFIAINNLNKVLPNASKASENRRIAVTDMMYNLGPGTFNEFQKFIKAFNEEKWDLAADEMMDSKAAVDLPQRYIELSEMIRKG